MGVAAGFSPSGCRRRCRQRVDKRVSTTPPCVPGASGGAPGSASIPAPMRSADRILRALPGLPGSLRADVGLLVADVVVGRKYTAVRLADGSVGVALTQHPEWSEGCCGHRDQSKAAPPEAGAPAATYVGHPLAHLVEHVGSRDPVVAAVALAGVNALVNRAELPLLPGDLLAHLDVRSSDIVGMVGYFGPLVGPLQARSRRLHIFERREEEGCLEAEQALELLPECDVAVVTAGTISNGTLDDLLVAASSCREVAMVGASTPMLPGAFLGTPVTWLSGSVVADAQAVLEVVGRGGGRRDFNRFLIKGNLPVP